MLALRLLAFSALVSILALLLVAGCGASEDVGPSVASESRPVPKGMVWIPLGTFTIGSDEGFVDESPAKELKMSGFFMDEHEVTNAQFAEFVEATGYVTVAERAIDPKEFPGVDPEKLKPGALVFVSGKGWDYVIGANWKHPEGPGSDIEGKEDHPVVQVAWEDAGAYAKWAGKELPTEAQWEYAARGGVAGQAFIWGSEPFDDKHPQANIWQGQFPLKNENTDGFLTTAPVKSFAPNKFGLYDMAGNVWEWCADWYSAAAYSEMADNDPKGPSSSNDPAEPGVAKRVLRGGSFLCADCYCKGYRPSARMKSSPDTGLFHSGFRCVINPSKTDPAE
ncbi:MAG: formylglycine-generating enzyme family protein [Fimbriimonadaceae bacterium]|nr:formylglycine-generating enzyme family protein [Fimbriimonadaceae bacterium]